jgi:hypothetical protein
MVLIFDPDISDAPTSGILPDIGFDTSSGLLEVSEDVFATNPLKSFLTFERVQAARGNRGYYTHDDKKDVLNPDGSGFYKGRVFLSLDEQAEIIEANNLQNDLKPTFGESQESLDMLIDLKRAELTRRFIIQNSDVNLAGQISVGLLASLFDPINIGAGFVPVIGQARYANMLAQQASRAGRTAVRAGTGMAEGAVGALALEPFILYQQQSLQADYDIVDSFANLAFGAGLGGGLRAGGGLIGDVLATRTSSKEAKQLGAALEQLEHETLAHAMSTAVGQLTSGRMVSGVDLMLRTSLENSTAVGRVLDLVDPIRKTADVQPLVVRGDFVNQQTADGITRTPAIALPVARGTESVIAKQVDELEEAGFETKVEQNETGEELSVSALVSNEVLARDEAGEFLAYRTKKEATQKLNQLKKSGVIETGEVIKIGKENLIAVTDDAKTLELLKANAKDIELPVHLPPAAFRASTGADGGQFLSPDKNLVAEALRDHHSTEGELFHAIDQELVKMADDLEAFGEIRPDNFNLEIQEIRASVENTRSPKDLEQFDAEQQQAQQNVDDLKEQEAAIKDAFACAIGNLK